MEVEQQAPVPSTGAAATRPPAASPGAPQNAPQEHRAHTRYAIQENSVLLVLNHGLSLECRILDLSLSGCRLEVSQPFTAAPRTRVEVAFKVHGVAFRLVGTVQWNRENRLLGIRFTETIPRRAEQLAEVIGELEAAARARAAQQAAQKAAAETEAAQQAREQAEAEARHWEEIQQIARKASAGRKAIALDSTPQTPSTRERRVHARHELNTTATIVLVKTGSRLKGRILDLSVSGCRIRGDERFPVGVYTRVETEFQFQGLPFLLGGVIQNMHDPQTVGIRFLDMSYRKREQLEHLIAELAELEAMHSPLVLDQAPEGDTGEAPGTPQS